MSKRSRGLLQNRANQEDLLIEKLDVKASVEDAMVDLKLGMRKKLTLKQLKELAGSSQLRYIIARYLSSYENDHLDDMQKWGQKIEEYCIPKPKDITTRLDGDPTIFLMENVAQLKMIFRLVVKDIETNPEKVKKMEAKLFEFLAPKLLGQSEE